ncbi:carboxylesterase [Xylariales sp. AK1849]|nr:carboxylesterase [Xylariales sp. AK1849]
MKRCIIGFAVAALFVPVTLTFTPAGQQTTPRSTDWTIGQTVKTSSGPVNGHAASNDTDVSEYLGIPYANPPVDGLRWQTPGKYTGTATINGSDFGYACMQASPLLSAADSIAGIDNQTVNGGLSSGTPQSEDCLTLNVWTRPQTGEASKAVMIWIHGGSFTSGSSRDSLYDGQYIAEEQDIVLVSINYRLNIFGFPGNPTSAPNLGLLDQRMAVEWVRDNIAGFGGDPDRIVVFGQSAGASSVDIHSYAFADDPIAAGFLCESGTATSFGLQNQGAASDLWFKAANQVGCDGGASQADAVFSCMMSMTSRRLANNVPAIGLGDTNGLPYGPVIDNKLVFSDYDTRKPAAKPMMVGNTDDEAGLFKWLVPSSTDVPQSFWNTINNQAFTCPTGLRASLNVLNGNPTWRYRWFGVFPNLVLSWFPLNGAWHGSELPSVFNTTPSNAIPNTEEQDTIGKYMRGAWAAFAKDTVDGLNKYDGWPEYSTKGQTLVRLALNNTVGPNLDTGDAYDAACTGIPTVTTGPTVTGTTASPTPSNDAGRRLVVPSWLKVFVFAFWLVSLCAVL